MKTTYSPLTLSDHGMEFCAPVDETIGRDVSVNRAVFAPLLSDLVRRVGEGNEAAILAAARNITAMATEFRENREKFGPVSPIVVPELEDTRAA